MTKQLSKIFIILAVLGIIVTPISFYFVLSYAPMELFMGIAQKIFYYHVPVASLSALSFLITFIFSILFLVKRNLKHDQVASVAAEIGLLLSTLTLVTGMLWARPVWGVWWTWDPRLTTTFVLWLIFAGYFLLRSQLKDRFKKALYSSVIGIIGFIDLPLVHFSVKLWSRGIHPPKPVLHPDMALALKIAFLATFIIVALTFILRLKVQFLVEDVKLLKNDRS